VVTDPLPKGVDFVKASEGCGAAAGVVTCAVQPAGELEVGGEADFQITVHVPFALGGQARSTPRPLPPRRPTRTSKTTPAP
jgi:hypothetical protein